MIEQVFWGTSKGLQGWKWIAIDFWTGCPEIKAAILVKFSTFIRKFFPLSLYFFACATIIIFSSYCKTIKHNYSTLQAIFIKQDISDVAVFL